ncbi:MAG: DUF4097 family beta strand repeat-containing protein [Melioribacteraceae bacterium]|nr:DUF4097 family beta strand repeat-containing protein [Melioribacteraceae bacterium]MCF8262920.1 DUF4097 family beta strand repeat-containing protein [Melioribacteraceae bacterium]MCF8431085.1 DUF4097 family beta strand repeat-containing protein [Melioribacteraceae bacterium]
MKTINKSIYLVCLIFLAASLNAQSWDLKKNFNVEPGKDLNLDFEIGASLDLEGWDKNEISIEIEVDGFEEDEVIFDFDESSRGLMVRGEKYSDFNCNRCGISVVVKLPKKFNVEFSTMGGGVKLKNIQGVLEGLTMGGSLSLSELIGKVEIKTMGGSIEVDRSDIDGMVETMGGSISMNDVKGDVDVKTMGGSISQNNVTGRTKDGRDVTISTMGGSIDIDEAPNGADVSTMGGSISANKVGNFFEAETMGGSIRVKELDGKIRAKTMGGDIEVNMVGDPNKGERDIYLSSMGGDIEVYVPKGMSMDIELEIELDGRDNYEIITDFDLEVKGERDEDDWGRRRKIEASGKIGSGKNKVRISTKSGDIYLRER